MGEKVKDDVAVGRRQFETDGVSNGEAVTKTFLEEARVTLGETIIVLTTLAATGDVADCASGIDGE